jgi:hypothetical protein
MSDNSNDASSFLIRMLSKHGSNGGHTDVSAICEIFPNAYDARLPDSPTVRCVIVDNVTLGGKKGCLYFDVGAKGCANLLWLLGRGGPPKKHHTAVGCHSEGFLSAIRAFKSSSIRAISRYEPRQDMKCMKFEIESYCKSAELSPVKNLDTKGFLTHGTLGVIECREWETAASYIQDPAEKEQFLRLLKPECETTFLAFWLENTELMPIFQKAHMKINSEYYGLLTHPTQPLSIDMYSGEEHLAANADTAIDVINNPRHDRDQFPVLKFECVACSKVLIVRLRIPGYNAVHYFTIDDAGKIATIPALPTFTPEFTLEASAHSKESDMALARTLGVSEEALRGIRILRNLVILGDPYWNDDEFQAIRNAGSPHLVLKIHTENMTAERNKVYIQDIIPTAAVKHTSNLGKAWMPVQKLLKLVLKDLIIKNYTGSDKKKCLHKYTGVTAWDGPTVLKQLGVSSVPTAPAPAAAAPAAPAEAAAQQQPANTIVVTDETDPSSIGVVTPSVSVIRSMTKAICVQHCGKYGLSITGTVDELRDRLVIHYHPDYAKYSLHDLMNYCLTHKDQIEQHVRENTGLERSRDITIVMEKLMALVESD